MPTQAVVDTGASDVTINITDAGRMGIDYVHGKRVTMNTANGPCRGWHVTLASVQVGNIVLRDVPGLVVLRCDIHEHMRGLVLVVDTPYFVITDTEGHYRITGLPAGHHALKVWLDSRTTLERPVDLRNNETLRVDFP